MKIVDVFHEWDDRAGLFRVYLTREDDDEGQPMESVMLGDSVECRLYRKAFLRCYKDLAHQDAQERVLGFEKEAAAKRVVKAVEAELKAIAKGEPAMTDEDFGYALSVGRMMAPRRKP